MSKFQRTKILEIVSHPYMINVKVSVKMNQWFRNINKKNFRKSDFLLLLKKLLFFRMLSDYCSWTVNRFEQKPSTFIVSGGQTIKICFPIFCRRLWWLWKLDIYCVLGWKVKNYLLQAEDPDKLIITDSGPFYHLY